MLKLYHNIPIIIFVFWFAYRFYKRSNNDKNSAFPLGTGCFAFGASMFSFLILVYMAIILLYPELQTVYNNITMDQYTAKIITVDSHKKRYKNKIKTLYTPTIQFTPEESSLALVEKLNIASKDSLEVGKTYDVLYNSKTSNIIPYSKINILLILIGLIPFGLIIYSIYYTFFMV